MFWLGFAVLGQRKNTRLGLTLGHRDVGSSEELAARLEGKMTEYELASGNFPPREVVNGPVFENQGFGDDINLLRFPAPKWHEQDHPFNPMEWEMAKIVKHAQKHLKLQIEDLRKIMGRNLQRLLGIS